MPEHEVKTVPECGWKGAKNGELLALAAGRYDAFLTVDAGIEYQQNLGSLGVRSRQARVSWWRRA